MSLPIKSQHKGSENFSSRWAGTNLEVKREDYAQASIPKKGKSAGSQIKYVHREPHDNKLGETILTDKWGLKTIPV